MVTLGGCIEPESGILPWFFSGNAQWVYSLKLKIMVYEKSTIFSKFQLSTILYPGVDKIVYTVVVSGPPYYHDG